MTETLIDNRYLASYYPTTKCFKLVEEARGIGGQWTTVNEEQDRFINYIYPKSLEELDKFLDSELYGKISEKVEEINDFLIKNGGTIQLEKSNDPTELYVASVLNIAAKWEYDCTKTSITTPEKEKIEGVKTNKAVVESNQKGDRIYSIKLGNEDTIYLCDLKDNPEEFVNEFYISRESNKREQYVSLEFPAVSFNKVRKLEEMIELSYKAPNSQFESWIIRQGFEQSIFNMDYTGVKLIVLTAYSGYSGCGNYGVNIIDKPFTLWIERDGLSFPYFITNVLKENFKYQ